MTVRKPNPKNVRLEVWHAREGGLVYRRNELIAQFSGPPAMAKARALVAARAPQMRELLAEIVSAFEDVLGDDLIELINDQLEGSRPASP